MSNLLGLKGFFLKIFSVLVSILNLVVLISLNSSESYDYFRNVGILYLLTFLTGGGLNKFILSMRRCSTVDNVSSVVNFLHLFSALVVIVYVLYSRAIILSFGLLIVVESYRQSQFWLKANSGNVNLLVDNRLVLSETVASVLITIGLYFHRIDWAIISRPIVLFLASFFIFNWKFSFVSPFKFFFSDTKIVKEVFFSSMSRFVNILSSRALVVVATGVYDTSELKLLGILEKISTFVTTMLNWLWNRLYISIGFNSSKSFNSILIYGLLPVSWIFMFGNGPIYFMISLTLIRIVKEYSSFRFLKGANYKIPFVMSLLFLLLVLCDLRTTYSIVVVFSFYSVFALFDRLNLAKKFL